MNVTELARQLKTTREELLQKLPDLGFDIGHRAIKVDNVIAERIKQAWAQGERRERLKSKMEKQQRNTERAQSAAEPGGTSITIGDRITVSDLAEKLNTNVTHLIGYLMKNGIMASLNQEIDFETASIVVEDYGFKPVRGNADDAKKEAASTAELHVLKQQIASEEGATARPPVVVVMGHVDHGKTTLLDAVRETNVAEGESGGITQHIGAYQVVEKDRLITFLDTPGHEAFRAMRERGGQVADVAILVVAADDGLKPQTLESIRVIQKENIPFVVAINKIDKPGADIDKVKKELSEINLVPEDWGGKTICVPISAKKKEHIPELLDMVLLVADLEKFSANSDRDACGVIIEAHIDRSEGAVATVLVNTGTLKIGDEVTIGQTHGKIKALKNWKGENVATATPSMPVKILGLRGAPHIGDILRVAVLDRAKRKSRAKDYRFVDVDTQQQPATDEDDETQKKGELNIIVKADVLGSLEAFLASLKKLENKDVAIHVLKQGLGNITESDLALAEDVGAVIYGFSVTPSAEAQRMSYNSSVEIKTSKVIYELLDDIKARASTFIRKEIIEVPQGQLEILKVFRDSREQSIVGGRVKKAKITDGAKFRVMRENEPIDEGTIIEVQLNKQKVSEAPEGSECGLKVKGARGFHEGDILACYTEEERET